MRAPAQRWLEPTAASSQAAWARMIVAAVVLILANCSPSKPHAAASPTPSRREPGFGLSRTAGTGAPTATAASPGAPSSTVGNGLVVATMGQNLVVLDAVTGHLVRTLVTVGQLGDTASELSSLQGITVSPDGATVYYSEITVGGSSCAQGIKKVPTAGGAPVDVVAGASPALSHDGGRLAYVVGDCGTLPAGATGNQVRVQDLATAGAPSTAYPADPADKSPPSPGLLAWSPDGTKLAVVEVSQQLGQSSLHSLTLAPNATYDPSPTLGPPASAPPGTSWPAAAYLPDGRILVGQTCCDSGGASATTTMGAALILAPDGTAAQTLMATLPVSSVAVDRSGSHFFWVMGGALWTSGPGSPPTAIAQGIGAVAD